MVVNAATFKIETTISGFNSPRYLYLSAIAKLYVSDFIRQQISNCKSVNQHYLRLYSWPLQAQEQMKMDFMKSFVHHSSLIEFYVINSMTDLLTDSIVLAYSTLSVKIKAVCCGLCAVAFIETKAIGFSTAKPIDNQVIKSLYFNGNHAPAYVHE